MTARLGDVDTICAIVGGIVALSAPEMIRAACPNLSTRSRDMNVGGAWSSIDANGFGTSNASGVIGGVYGGYNWQLAPQWLIGIEGDSSWTDLNGTIGFGKVNWLGSVRGRIGYTPTSTMLFYFTGGAAWRTIDNSGVSSFAGSTDQTKSGWVIGGGVEWAPWPSNWLVRAEYLNYNFTGLAAGPFSTDLTINEVRAGVAYKF